MGLTCVIVAVSLILLIVILVKMSKQAGQQNDDSFADRLIDKLLLSMNEQQGKSNHMMIDTVIQSISKLGDSLCNNQARQDAIVKDKLAEVAQSLENMRSDISAALVDIRDTNGKYMDKLRQENKESLDRINDTVNEKLQKTLDDRVAKSFEAVNQRLKDVYEGLGEMRAVASGVTDLKNVLSNVKTRGIMGEIQLGNILSEILSPEQYGSQVSVVPNSSEAVDFAVKLPGSGDIDAVYLPIDSKFPGDTYSDLVDAYETGDPAIVKARRKTLETEILRCAKSIHDKYIVIPYTTNFAVMFLPFEGLYAEVVNMGLVERLQRDYSINIAGPSTMAALLNSLHMGFRTLAVQQKSNEVWKILGAAKTEFEKFEKGLDMVRKRLQDADGELDKLVGTRTRVINRKLASVDRLDDGEAQRALDE